MRTTAPPRPTTSGPVWLGRAALVLVPVMWAVAHATRSVWSRGWTPGELPDHPIATAITWAALAVGCMSPFLLLPSGTMRDAALDDGILTIMTVLGRRRIDLGRLRKVGSLSLVGRRDDQDAYLLYLRSSGGRWVLVSLGTSRRMPREVRRRIVAAMEERPGVVSVRARATLRFGEMPSLGQVLARATMTVVLLPAAYGVSAFVVFSLILQICFPGPW